MSDYCCSHKVVAEFDTMAAELGVKIDKKQVQLADVAYIVVISGMTALAAGAVGAVGGGATPWVLVGATAFFVSDLGVARNRFVAPGFINRAVGLPLYYAATTILAATARGGG